MKKNFKVILVVVVIAATLWSFIPKKTNDPEKDKMLLDFIAFVLEKGHYDPANLNDDLSKDIFKNYIETLDPQKKFLLKSDIDEFKVYENQIDDFIRDRDLTFFNLTYDRIKKRMKEAEVVVKNLNEIPFDFNVDESIDLEYSKQDFAENYIDLKTRWRLQMKYSILSNLVDKQEIEKDKKEKDSTYIEKEFNVLEKESRAIIQKNLTEYFAFFEDFNIDDWFEIYVNSIVTQFDPHTYYFAADEKEKFDTSMSGKLEGIGARLQKSNEYTEITELISGGPAWKSKELDPGDLILKVAQGNEIPIDVVGMRLDDVVKKIKGPKGTMVKLTVKKVDGTIVVITLMRDIVEIEETYAKSTIIEKNGEKYGMIYLPKFYIDFENKDNRDSAKDVAKEVEKLKKENVKGIIMDLRNNGGGSLKTVVDITGLFIQEGPVVQIKNKKSKEVLYDHDPSVLWDGPLVVMINNFSASASEIFAAAIQDYKRGIVIGSKQSYGKGTVQTVFDLNQFSPKNSKLGDFGALKITTQKFYRINGGSTQLEGVSSDIETPDIYSYIKIGERDVENAMNWDKIEPTNYSETKSVNNFNSVIENSKKRISESEQFKLIKENAKWISERKDKNVISLNINKFKEELKTLEEGSKKFKSISKFKNNLDFRFLKEELEISKTDTIFERKRNDWHDDLKKDAYLNEAINVLSEIKNKTQVSFNSKDKKLVDINGNFVKK